MEHRRDAGVVGGSSLAWPRLRDPRWSDGTSAAPPPYLKTCHRIERIEMFEGLIFDVEGTLLDSVAQNQQSLQDALEKSGYRVRSRRFAPTRASTAIRRCSSWSRMHPTASALPSSRTGLKSTSATICRPSSRWKGCVTSSGSWRSK